MERQIRHCFRGICGQRLERRDGQSRSPRILYGVGSRELVVAPTRPIGLTLLVLVESVGYVVYRLACPCACASWQAYLASTRVIPSRDLHSVVCINHTSFRGGRLALSDLKTRSGRYTVCSNIRCARPRGSATDLSPWRRVPKQANHRQVHAGCGVHAVPLEVPMFSPDAELASTPTPTTQSSLSCRTHRGARTSSWEDTTVSRANVAGAIYSQFQKTHGRCS